MKALFKQIEIGRPQIIAACFLLALLLQALAAIYWTPLGVNEMQIIRASAELQSGQDPDHHFAAVNDSIIVYRVLGETIAGWRWVNIHLPPPDDTDVEANMKGEQLIVRLPFAVFAVWMGGALWWVTRRLFGNSGGYVALALFCFSPWVVAMSARINADVIAAW